MNLPELGVGLTWFAGLEPALDSNAGPSHVLDLLDVLEIEPQTFWHRHPDGQSQVVHLDILDSIRQLPMRKLMHGVGYPIGGTRPPLPEALSLLSQMAIDLDVPWMSEHLSFNQAAMPSGLHSTGFFLPPRQTLVGVDASVRSIRVMSSRMPIPVAIETGVNYLRQRGDELADGEFVARIAEAADCGILLDLHNIWANQRNCRQSIEDFLSQLPLDRVWEVHLAGGSERNGYWLDAHSGGIPQELFEIAASVVGRLPNLKAIIFEFFSVYLPHTEHSIFRTQLEHLRRLWDMRGCDSRIPASPAASATSAGLTPPAAQPTSVTPVEWEDTLGTLAVGGKLDTPLAAELRADPGLDIIRYVIEQFRASMIVRMLRMTARLLMLERGNEYFEGLLGEYWRNNPPETYAYAEADGFAAFLRTRDHGIAYLDEVLQYDEAMMQVGTEGREQLVPFTVDPLPLLRALGAGRKPDMILYGSFEILLTPDAKTPPGSEVMAIH